MTVTAIPDDYGDSNHNSGADDFWVEYFHDPLNRVTAVTERGEDPLVGYLATYSYDPLSRRTALSLGNGRDYGDSNRNSAATALIPAH